MSAKAFLTEITQSMGALMMFAFDLESESGKAQFLEHLDEMEGTVLLQGYVPLADSIELLRDIPNIVDIDAQQAELRKIELSIYEQLASIQVVDDPEDYSTKGQLPASILYLWASENLLDNLASLSAILRKLKSAEQTDEEVNQLLLQLRTIFKHIHYGCKHYALDTAAQLCMALYDLFERSHGVNNAIDALLINMTQQFIAELNVIVAEIEEGEQPNLTGVRHLLEQAPDVPFRTQGKETAKQIEILLGLPETFLRVLTPDSVDAIDKARADKRHFYIIQAQMNNNDASDMAFLTWISQGHTHVINNVTNQSGVALFDVLVDSSLTRVEIMQALTKIGSEYQLSDWKSCC